jgi:hypothetical protein
MIVTPTVTSAMSMVRRAGSASVSWRSTTAASSHATPSTVGISPYRAPK